MAGLRNTEVNVNTVVLLDYSIL